MSKVNLLVRMEVAQEEVGPGRESLLLPRGGWRRWQGCSLQRSPSTNKQEAKPGWPGGRGVLPRAGCPSPCRASFPASGRSYGRRQTLVQGYQGRPHLACLFPAPGSGSVSLAACSQPLWQCLYQGNRFRTSESWLLKQLGRLPRWLRGKESACQCWRRRGCGFDP